MLSATFHALVIGVACLFALESCGQDKTQPRVLELVAGEGDNYGATVAPKLGSPGGVKVDVPAIPMPKPLPEPEPTPPQPEPQTVTPPPEPTPAVTPAPKPPPKAVVPKKDPDAIPNISRQIKRKVWAADVRAKKEVAKERAAEEKRLKKEEYDRQQRAKIASARAGSSPRVSHIDAEGIAKGVIGGSTDNKVGGAGGKALVADQGAATDRYYAMLKEKVRNAIDKPPAISDDLSVTIIFHISATGRISNVRVEKSSGSEEWDRAVVQAFGRVSMPDHPEHRGEDAELILTTKDADE